MFLKLEAAPRVWRSATRTSWRRSAVWGGTPTSPTAALSGLDALSRWRKLWLKTLWFMEEVATEGRLLIDQHLRPFKLISFPRCYPTIITWRSQQRSQLYRPRPDTRKVFRTDTHREQTHNRREWTDRLEGDNRRDKIQGTQILTLENIAYILVEFNLFTYILKSISLVEDAASTTL